MPESFSVGEIVQLKSGGPLMTIDRMGGGGDVVCVYFDNDHKLQTVAFKPDSLKKASPR